MKCSIGKIFSILLLQQVNIYPTGLCRALYTVDRGQIHSKFTWYHKVLFFEVSRVRFRMF